MNKIRIGYFADGPWSHQTLEKLLNDSLIDISFICARFNSPDLSLKIKAEQHAIDYFIHPNVNSEEFLDKIAMYNCDLFVSMSFDQIFKKMIINTPRLGIINCHAGLLPFYRGRNVLNWVLINNEKEFGITVHYINEEIDGGDILAQRSFPITDNDNYATLLACAYKECAALLYETIKNLQEKKITPIKQSEIHKLGFYCVKRMEGDERLNWNQTSREVFNFARAICPPGPSARTTLNGKELHINELELIQNAPVYKGIPGSVIGKGVDFFLVKTTDSYVKVTQWSGVDNVSIGSRLK